jgi:hypothetical protein
VRTDVRCMLTRTTFIEGVPEQVDSEPSRSDRVASARLIRKVYEVHATPCPHCGADMRVLSVIEEAAGIERILGRLGCRDPRPPSQASPASDDWPTNGQMPLTYGPVPDIAERVDQGLDRPRLGWRPVIRRRSGQRGLRSARWSRRRGDTGRSRGIRSYVKASPPGADGVPGPPQPGAAEGKFLSLHAPESLPKRKPGIQACDSNTAAPLHFARRGGIRR